MQERGAIYPPDRKGRGALHQIVFTSRAARSLSSDDVARLCDQAALRNAVEEITGLFLYDGARFLSALEGEVKVLENTFARIMSDQRHYGIEILSSREVRNREFARLPMSCPLTNDDPRSTNAVEIVKSSVAGLSDIKARAYFIGFAKLFRWWFVAWRSRWRTST